MSSSLVHSLVSPSVLYHRSNSSKSDSKWSPAQNRVNWAWSRERFIARAVCLAKMGCIEGLRLKWRGTHGDIGFSLNFIFRKRTSSTGTYRQKLLILHLWTTFYHMFHLTRPSSNHFTWDIYHFSLASTSSPTSPSCATWRITASRRARWALSPLVPSPVSSVGWWRTRLML